MTPVLLDTGPIVALLDRGQQHHVICVQLLSTLDAPLLTCESVISEACHLLRRVSGAAQAVVQNVESGSFQIPYRAAGRSAALARLLKKYANVPMAFADACLVDMASELNTARIFTLDDDFRVYRWGRNRPFELILQGD
jgi:uncharacterized protein